MQTINETRCEMVAIMQARTDTSPVSAYFMGWRLVNGTTYLATLATVTNRLSHHCDESWLIDLFKQNSQPLLKAQLHLTSNRVPVMSYTIDQALHLLFWARYYLPIISLASI